LLQNIPVQTIRQRAADVCDVKFAVSLKQRPVPAGCRSHSDRFCKRSFRRSRRLRTADVSDVEFAVFPSSKDLLLQVASRCTTDFASKHFLPDRLLQSSDHTALDSAIENAAALMRYGCFASRTA